MHWRRQRVKDNQLAGWQIGFCYLTEHRRAHAHLQPQKFMSADKPLHCRPGVIRGVSTCGGHLDRQQNQRFLSSGRIMRRSKEFVWAVHCLEIGMEWWEWKVSPAAWLRPCPRKQEPSYHPYNPTKETLDYYCLFLPSRSNNSVNGQSFGCEELAVLMRLNDKEWL